MASKPFRFHPEAKEEFREAVRWYRARNFAISTELRLAISSAVRATADAPLRRPTYLYGTRRYVLNRFPFSIVYLNENDSLIVIAIAHAKRKPGYWKKRL